MRIPIVVPDIQTGTEALRLCGWRLDEGEFVVAGDPIIELVFPGIMFDVVAPGTGRLAELNAAIDSKVYPGDILGWIENGLDSDEPNPSNCLSERRT